MGFQPVAGLLYSVLCNLSESGVWTPAKPNVAFFELWKRRQGRNDLSRKVGLSLVKVAHQRELESSGANPRRQVLCCPEPVIKQQSSPVVGASKRLVVMSCISSLAMTLWRTYPGWSQWSVAALDTRLTSPPVMTRGFVEHNLETGQRRERQRTEVPQRLKRPFVAVVNDESVGGKQQCRSLDVEGPAR